MAKEINSLWLGNSKGKERDDLEKIVRNNITLLSTLNQIVLDKIATIEAQEETLSLYDNPNWAVRQSHQNGRRAAYKEILKLTAFLD